MTLSEFQQHFGSEEVCLLHLETSRWGKDGERRYCPHCGSLKSYKFKGGKLYKCADCRKQFTVKVGTMFTDSHVSLKNWYLAIYLAFSLKKGTSSVQLAKYLGVTQPTAWFMLQRIRNTIVESGNSQMLGGVVEVDETYAGGNRHDGRRGRGTTGKKPIVGLVERGGDMRIKATVDTTATTLKKLIRENVAIGSVVATDEYPAYKRLDKYGYDHQRVNHHQGQWVNALASTNNLEGFWKHLKAGIDAIYIHVSPKHLQLYCNEYQYRYNTRKLTDYQRFGLWFGLCAGKLTYKELING